LLSIAESFCPADEMISGICVALWFRAVELPVGVTRRKTALLV